ncbi:GNAT family N-acetyltransferase [Hyphomonas pacifica]|uniref:Uncharacterized protein n=1 Tax=Hyphomonas pacifica TaxID=1280941 RepID=A0A062TX46_9PROT|nr:GNAT family N-acetyltransferase [Hyphomonas pacifica]KCZ50592.1 hypothetical protein HY2_13485 [Hyphomonas pacifica]RAN33017.1 hypothetical protein HY3_13740 [Hyphomonas pacifica]
MYTHPAAGWRIRPFSRRDYRPCYQLLRDCLTEFPWRSPAAPYLRKLFNSLPSARAWVAEEPNAGVVGFLTLRPEVCYIDHLFVARDWRLCGVGRGLLDVARQETGRPLSLDVDMQNVNARKAYEALGWKVGARTGSAKAEQIRLIGP